MIDRIFIELGVLIDMRSLSRPSPTRVMTFLTQPTLL